MIQTVQVFQDGVLIDEYQVDVPDPAPEDNTVLPPEFADDLQSVTTVAGLKEVLLKYLGQQ